MLRQLRKSLFWHLTIIETNSFRIIAGEFRGRKFSFPDAAGLRPTSGKIRETLFNWLQFDIAGKSVLEPFTGSGALSLEAISRGAKAVYSIEQNNTIFKQLLVNFKSFPSEKFKLINDDALTHLNQVTNKSFDLVFLDPPFAKEILPQILKLIADNGYINQTSKIYIESEFQINNDNLSALNGYRYNIAKQKKSGNVHYCLINLDAL
ncbi:MAG: 16S rRNA (guanine(966)-N(2))-methyltransferase RsmD [Gammaproteobacteria bacterium]